MPSDQNNINPNKPIGRFEIKCKSTSLTWDNNGYNEDYMAGIISKEDYISILEVSSKLFGEALNKKRINDDVSFPRPMIILSYTSFISAIVYPIFLFIGAIKQSILYTLLSITFLVISVGIAFVLSILNHRKKISKFKSLETFIKDSIDEYFMVINSRFNGKIEFKFHPASKDDDDNRIELMTYVKTQYLMEQDMDKIRESSESINQNESVDGSVGSDNNSGVRNVDISANASDNRLNNKSQEIEGMMSGSYQSREKKKFKFRKGKK